MLIHELLKKDPDIVPEEATLIILDIKSAVCVANDGKNTKHSSHIAKYYICEKLCKLRNAQD